MENGEITMHINTHTINDKKAAEVVAGKIVIESVQDGLDLLGDLYYQGFDQVIIYEVEISPAFFDLRNGMAGEILQKFSTYRMQLAIVGNFEKYPGKSIREFIYESNRWGHVSFVGTLSEALAQLSRI